MRTPVRFQPLDRLSNREGDDEQCRLLFSLNTFAERERDTVPDMLYYYWDSLRGDGRRIPRLADFRPRQVFGPQANLLIRGVDVRAEDPTHFIMRDHPGGPISPLPNGLEGKPMSAFPCRIHVAATLAEYQLCKTLRRPLYHELFQVACGIPRHYTRILLPLADDSGRVVRLAYGLHLQTLFGEFSRG